MWNNVGMGRNKTGLTSAIEEIRKLRDEFWQDVRVVGSPDDMNNDLERAGRLADFLELGELMARDALHREESCGGHFREEYQTEEGEAKRNDEQFSYVAAWEFAGAGNEPKLHKEPLTFEYVKPSQRSYK
jgi:succinate dehydrogenase / fumarate reductase flavoprotein subunit